MPECKGKCTSDTGNEPFPRVLWLPKPEEAANDIERYVHAASRDPASVPGVRRGPPQLGQAVIIRQIGRAHV